MDPKVLNTTFGIVAAVSRITAMSMPMLAEVENEKIPLMVIFVLNFIAFIASLFFRKR